MFAPQPMPVAWQSSNVQSVIDTPTLGEAIEITPSEFNAVVTFLKLHFEMLMSLQPKYLMPLALKSMFLISPAEVDVK